jgi:hypothetical protein
MDWSVIIILIGSLLILVLAIAVVMHRKYKTRPNYKVFFIIGLTWIPLGIATENYVFTIAGIVMMIVGLSRKKEWRQEPKWSELPPQVKRLKLIVITVITVVLLVLLLTFLLNR